MTLAAKYPGHCHLCDSPIYVGDSIQRSNGARRYSLYAHSRCVPAAGVANRAHFEVWVTVADANGWIPVGCRKRYVHRGPANAVAKQLCSMGAVAEVREV